MSIEIHAFLSSTRVPSTDEWQRAIDESGLGLTIDPDLKPWDFSGFLPCRLNGHAEVTGFEIYYEEAAELLSDNPNAREAVGDRDSCVSFRISSSMAECAAMLIAALALMRVCGAVVYYPDDDKICTDNDLLTEANECLNTVRSEVPPS